MKIYEREEITLELQGWIPTEKAQLIVGEDLSPCRENGGTPVRLQLSRMMDVRTNRLLIPSMNFSEAIWRIAVEHQGASAWFIPLCEISHSLPRMLLNYLFRIPVRKAAFLFMEKRKSLVTHHRHASGRVMRCHVELGPEETTVDPDNRHLVRAGGSLYLLNQTSHKADFRRDSSVDILKDEISSDVFGVPVIWNSKCLVKRGQTDKHEQAGRVKNLIRV